MLKGQWFGPYAGTSSGNAIIEFDERDGHLTGTATVYENDNRLPATFALVTVPLNTSSLDIRVPLHPIDWNTGDPAPWSQLSHLYPGISMSAFADTKWRLSVDTLYVSWVTELGTFGLAVLSQGKPNAPSKRSPLPVQSWAEFKIFAASLEPYRYIFRGQTDNNWKIRTYFHRTGRSDLRRFINYDVNLLHRNLSGLTSHFFNLANPIENGAFYTLAQHHGYPTPLLDWTQSPFVASYFAYRNLPKKDRTDDKKVRIILFDSKEWQKDFLQFQRFTPALRHFSLFAPLGINNTRLVPQQALSTISNVDDIEEYIEEIEAARGKTYLQVIDLPGSERQQVMQELSMMGITAGSLFPGLDGACEQLRERNFDL
jgi:hypothetical protein